MAFLPINFEDGQLVKLPMYNGGSSASYTVGQALIIASGYYTTSVTGGQTDIEAVCMEAGTVTTDGTELLCMPTRGSRFIADTAADTIATQVGTYVDLASATTLDSTASDDDIFYVESIHYPLTGKQVQGFFMHGTPLA